MNKKISCYVVSANYGKYLEECLISLLPQASLLFELVFVDVGSNDNTNYLFNKYIDLFKKSIRTVNLINLEHKNLLEVMDNVVHDLSGDFLFRLDADDFLEPNYLSSIHEKINNSDVDLLYSGYNIINSYSLRIGQQIANECVGIAKPPHGAMTLISRRLVSKIPSYSILGSSGQDGLINYIIASKYSLFIDFIAAPLFNYRQHSSSLTYNSLAFNKKRISVLESFVSVVDKIDINFIIIIDDFYSSDEAYQKFLKKYINQIFPLLENYFSKLVITVSIFASSEFISRMRSLIHSDDSLSKFGFYLYDNERPGRDHFHAAAYALKNKYIISSNSYLYIDLLSQPPLDSTAYILPIYYFLLDPRVNMCITGFYSYKISINASDDFSELVLPTSLSRSLTNKHFVPSGGLFVLRNTNYIDSVTFSPVLID